MSTYFQLNKLRENKRGGDTWKKSSGSIDKSCTILVDEQTKNYSKGGENRRNEALLFPSSIFHLPFTLLTKPKSLVLDKNETKRTSKCKKRGKVYERRRMKENVDRISFDLSKKNAGDKSVDGSSCEKYKLREVKRGVLRSESTDEPENIIRMSLLDNTISTPGRATVEEINMVNMATVKKHNVESRPFLLPYCNSALKEISDGIASNKISAGMYNYGEEEVDIPVKYIESRTATGRIVGYCSTFDTNGTDCLKQVCRKLLLKQVSTFNGANNSSIVCGKDVTRLQKGEQYYPCRRKYSWQVVGTSSQTSKTLLTNLTRKEQVEVESGVFEHDQSMVCNCSVKYSWQIIGTTTQTCTKDITVETCRSAVSFLSARRENRGGDGRDKNGKGTGGESGTRIGTFWRNGKRFIVLNNQCTQTFAHKENQTVFAELYELRNVMVVK